jgi:FkbM family methyltransferase
MGHFHYSRKDRAAFYWNYFTAKVFRLWFEVKKPKMKMFLYEMLYSGLKFCDRESLLPSPFAEDTVLTKFGRFRIRPRTADMSICSPAFERRDVDYLLKLIDGLIREGKSALFLDVGADIGTFTVTVGNRFRNCPKLRIAAFEPMPSSYSLLKENITLNGLSEMADTFNVALYNEDSVQLTFRFNPKAPASSGLEVSSGADTGAVRVPARTLDAIMADGKGDYDTLLFKIDVEGAERNVLEGATATLNSAKDVFLVIEDFVNPDIIRYLETIGARFLHKLTPYNSWWHYSGGR